MSFGMNRVSLDQWLSFLICKCRPILLTHFSPLVTWNDMKACSKIMSIDWASRVVDQKLGMLLAKLMIKDKFSLRKSECPFVRKLVESLLFHNIDRLKIPIGDFVWTVNNYWNKKQFIIILVLLPFWSLQMSMKISSEKSNWDINIPVFWSVWLLIDRVSGIYSQFIDT